MPFQISLHEENKTLGKSQNLPRRTIKSVVFPQRTSGKTDNPNKLGKNRREYGHPNSKLQVKWITFRRRRGDRDHRRSQGNRWSRGARGRG